MNQIVYFIILFSLSYFCIHLLANIRAPVALFVGVLHVLGACILSPCQTCCSYTIADNRRIRLRIYLSIFEFYSIFFLLCVILRALFFLVFCFIIYIYYLSILSSISGTEEKNEPINL